MTALAGSPFSAGGAGTGSTIAQSAIIASHGRYVWTRANRISVPAVGSDGSLSLVGSPVSSGGIEPVSIAVHRRLVYVANEGDGTSGSNYTGFRLGSGGVLKPLSGSTVPLPATALPGDILFNGTGNNLIGVEVGTTDPSTFLIDSFRVRENGRLAPAAGSPFPAEAPGPFGSEFSPTDPHHLYVSNAHGGTGNGSVSAFSASANGKLESLARRIRTGKPRRAGSRSHATAGTVHGEHRRHDDLELRIRENGSLRYLSSTPFSVDSDPALRRAARRWWPLPLRGRCRDRVDQRIRGERRFSEGAHVVADSASDRCDSLRDRHRGELRPIERGTRAERPRPPPRPDSLVTFPGNR